MAETGTDNGDSPEDTLPDSNDTANLQKRAPRYRRWFLVAGGLLVAAAVVVATTLWLGRHRGNVDDLPWPIATADVPDSGTVSVTWLGISTLLIDDGNTQLLIDGAFTRLSPLDLALQRKVRSDLATINYAMDEFGMQRLAAIIPTHSHFDHAIDIGHIANRSSAIVLGSESSANIARGADVPVDQYQILASGERRYFGDFEITLLASAHVPQHWTRAGIGSGQVRTPLRQPARPWSWRGGAAASVIVEHPAGTTLIQGSAGFLDGQLADVDADVVFFSVAGLAAQGEEYTREYWQATVTASGATRALAIHWDDFTQPLGELKLLPEFADNVPEAAVWISVLADEDKIRVERPPFGIPLTLY